LIQAPPWLETALTIAYLTTLLYLCAFVVYAVTMIALAAIEGRRRRLQAHTTYRDDQASRYAIPVSIVSAVFDEEIIAVPATRSLLEQDFPDFEVIVVDDGSSDGTLAALIREFDLVPEHVFYRRTLESEPLKAVFKSRIEPRLTVLSKENGGKADALNCGINFARYRYVCCVDGDTMFVRDAVSRTMAIAAVDPGMTVAVASFFGTSPHPEAASGSGIKRPSLPRRLLMDFQHLDLMRSFVVYRLAQSRLNCMLCVPGGFGLWRRDVLLEMGGFSRDFTCEDIEMTFRIHERFHREGRPFKILSLPGMVAETEGPDNVRCLLSQRARWQRVTLETIWHYRRMFGRPRYGAAGMVGLPYYFLFEGLAPVIQLFGFIALGAAAITGLLDWSTYFALLGTMIFLVAIPTTVAVWIFDHSQRSYRLRSLGRMVLFGPLDFLLYRPLILVAGIRGWVEFLRKEKGWNKFPRNVRRPVREQAA
jgi:biofilm PGA synthesis N-glycosyltransferase PgaC